MTLYHPAIFGMLFLTYLQCGHKKCEISRILKEVDVLREQKFVPALPYEQYHACLRNILSYLLARDFSPETQLVYCEMKSPPAHFFVLLSYFRAALQEPLEKFYKISNGALEAIAELVSALTDSSPPSPQQLYQMLKISPEDIKAAALGKRSVFASKDCLKTVVESLLDGLITA
jgi:hypothetical protein